MRHQRRGPRSRAGLMAKPAKKSVVYWDWGKLPYLRWLRKSWQPWSWWIQRERAPWQSGSCDACQLWGRRDQRESPCQWSIRGKGLSIDYGILQYLIEQRSPDAHVSRGISGEESRSSRLSSHWSNSSIDSPQIIWNTVLLPYSSSSLRDSPWWPKYVAAAPRKAPMNWAAQYTTIRGMVILPSRNWVNEIAGFKWAPELR